MKRNDRVLQRRRRAPKPKRQARDLAPPAIDEARLRDATYLTIAELRVYGHFETENATRCFLSKHKVPRAAGRVRRRDFDRAFDALVEARDERRNGRRHGSTVSPAASRRTRNSADGNRVAGSVSA